MNIRSHTVSALTLVVLMGCSATPPSLSEADMREGIRMTTGYPGCPSCSKVKTYSSPVIARISTRFSDREAIGWINAKLTLVLTNRTENFVPQYQLVAEFTNSGVFSEGTEIYIDGTKLSAAGDRQGDKCFSSIGSGCSWRQAYILDAKRIKDALKSTSGLVLFIGKPFQTFARENDGYVQRSVAKQSIVGVRETLSPSVLAGFVSGLVAKGADMPAS